MPRIGPPLAVALCHALRNGREPFVRYVPLRRRPLLESLRLTRKKMGVVQKRKASPDRLVWRARVIELIIRRVYLLQREPHLRFGPIEPARFAGAQCDPISGAGLLEPTYRP